MILMEMVAEGRERASMNSALEHQNAHFWEQVTNIYFVNQ